MPIFQDVTLAWGGADHAIPHNRVLGAIAIVEQLITLGELSTMSEARQLRYAQLSGAYAALLRYAGVKVTDEQVFDAFFGNVGEGMVGKALEIVYKLHQLMIPPARLLEAEKKLAEKAAEEEPGKTMADGGSSPSASNPSSAEGT